MATKTISLETDAYDILAREKGEKESFSEVVRRVVKERTAFGTALPALTTDELIEALKPFEGIGAGRRIKPYRRRRHAAA